MRGTALLRGRLNQEVRLYRSCLILDSAWTWPRMWIFCLRKRESPMPTAKDPSHFLLYFCFSLHILYDFFAFSSLFLRFYFHPFSLFVLFSFCSLWNILFHLYLLLFSLLFSFFIFLWFFDFFFIPLFLFLRRFFLFFIPISFSFFFIPLFLFLRFIFVFLLCYVPFSFSSSFCFLLVFLFRFLISSFSLPAAGSWSRKRAAASSPLHLRTVASSGFLRDDRPGGVCGPGKTGTRRLESDHMVRGVSCFRFGCHLLDSSSRPPRIGEE